MDFEQELQELTDAAREAGTPLVDIIAALNAHVAALTDEGAEEEAAENAEGEDETRHMTTFDRKVFFDSVRASLFGGSLSQTQVDGMNFKLDQWEDHPISDDLRHLAYPFATSYWETARTMWPVEEIGKGKGHAYGKPDPETGQTFYGRGDVQLTWKEDYQRATVKLGLSGDNDLVWHPVKALDPKISADVMYRGMSKGWFTGKKLGQFFSASANDPVAARIIINADVRKNGAKIAAIHADFLAALQAAAEVAEPAPVPKPEPRPTLIAITKGDGPVVVTLDGEVLVAT